MVLEHLAAAIDELREAREDADLGTRLMIESAIDDVIAIRNRTENIQENDEHRD